jgi:hypothetical protein
LNTLRRRTFVSSSKNFIFSDQPALAHAVSPESGGSSRAVSVENTVGVIQSQLPERRCVVTVSPRLLDENAVSRLWHRGMAGMAVL